MSIVLERASVLDSLTSPSAMAPPARVPSLLAAPAPTPAPASAASSHEGTPTPGTPTPSPATPLPTTAATPAPTTTSLDASAPPPPAPPVTEIDGHLYALVHTPPATAHPTPADLATGAFRVALLPDPTGVRAALVAFVDRLIAVGSEECPRIEQFLFGRLTGNLAPRCVASVARTDPHMDVLRAELAEGAQLALAHPLKVLAFFEGLYADFGALANARPFQPPRHFVEIEEERARAAAAAAKAAQERAEQQAKRGGRPAAPAAAAPSNTQPDGPSAGPDAQAAGGAGAASAEGGATGGAASGQNGGGAPAASSNATHAGDESVGRLADEIAALQAELQAWMDLGERIDGAVDDISAGGLFELDARPIKRRLRALVDQAVAAVVRRVEDQLDASNALTCQAFEGFVGVLEREPGSVEELFDFLAKLEKAWPPSSCFHFQELSPPHALVLCCCLATLRACCLRYIAPSFGVVSSHLFRLSHCLPCRVHAAALGWLSANKFQLHSHDPPVFMTRRLVLLLLPVAAAASAGRGVVAPPQARALPRKQAGGGRCGRLRTAPPRCYL